MVHYLQQLLLLMATYILFVNCTETNQQPILNQSPKIEESIKTLRGAKTLSEFTANFQKIDLRNLLLNKTAGVSIQLPQYESEYIKIVGQTKNLHQFVNTEELMADMRSMEGDLNHQTFLKLVLQNIDALKSLNAFDWKSTDQRNSKGIFYIPFILNKNSL